MTHALSTSTSAMLPDTAPKELLKWNWQPQPAAQRLINDLVNAFLARNTFAAKLARRMTDETGTRFADWIDHIVAPESIVPGGLTKALAANDFLPEKSGDSTCFVNRKGIFPILGNSGKGKKALFLIAIKCESAVEFLQAHNLAHFDSMNDGAKDRGVASRTRMSLGSRENASELWAIERHGLWGFRYDTSSPAKRIKALYHLDAFRTRPRTGGLTPSERKKTWAATFAIVDAAIKEIGRDWACDLFFKAEREFWQRRNRAAQVQFARQQKLGLGWANHDHHTYRSSREAFPNLVKLWEKLGFHCRERFYAGADAGWGAQVMEQPITGITTFNDVDMSPEELLVGDFAHKGFAKKLDKLSTVGLWCELHGEAVFDAGMHHLECQFDWHALVAQLERDAGVKHMAPFTTFPYLRQAFTEGERWSVDAARVASLLDRRLITKAQSELFLRDGALGSHMENLERNDGFKGFNQQGVSDIIARTDARRVAEAQGVGG